MLGCSRQGLLQEQHGHFKVQRPNPALPTGESGSGIAQHESALFIRRIGLDHAPDELHFCWVQGGRIWLKQQRQKQLKALTQTFSAGLLCEIPELRVAKELANGLCGNAEAVR